ASMRVGILGLGQIGTAIARRLDVLGATVGYTGRSAQRGVAYPYFTGPEALAEWCDLLVVSCPSTTETRKLVNAAVLQALGPEGMLVNIARGNIIDETALIGALARGEISGAGLDVFENEPHPPPGLLDSDRTI